MSKHLFGASVLLLASLTCGAASATTYDINDDHCGGSGCGLSGTIGEIFVTGTTSSLTVDLDLNTSPANLFLHQSNGSGASTGLYFNLSGTGIAFSGVSADDQSGTPGWTFTSSGPGSFSEDHVGIGNYAILCDSSVAGNTCGKNIDFTVTGTGLAFNNLIIDPKNGTVSPDIFGLDISNNGTTGPYGAVMCTENCLSPPSQQGTTPLPSALPLFAAGLGGVALFGWRRKRRISA
jgi:hypothetical protein